MKCYMCSYSSLTSFVSILVCNWNCMIGRICLNLSTISRSSLLDMRFQVTLPSSVSRRQLEDSWETTKIMASCLPQYWLQTGPSIRVSMHFDFCDMPVNCFPVPLTIDKLIGVHCTHGLNRTGYLVCRLVSTWLDVFKCLTEVHQIKLTNTSPLVGT